LVSSHSFASSVVFAAKQVPTVKPLCATLSPSPSLLLLLLLMLLLLKTT
jgi:hypothetical protein